MFVGGGASTLLLVQYLQSLLKLLDQTRTDLLCLHVEDVPQELPLKCLLSLRFESQHYDCCSNDALPKMGEAFTESILEPLVNKLWNTCQQGSRIQPTTSPDFNHTFSPDPKKETVKNELSLS